MEDANSTLKPPFSELLSEKGALTERAFSEKLFWHGQRLLPMAGSPGGSAGWAHWK